MPATKLQHANKTQNNTLQHMHNNTMHTVEVISKCGLYSELTVYTFSDTEDVWCSTTAYWSMCKRPFFHSLHFQHCCLGSCAIFVHLAILPSLTTPPPLLLRLLSSSLHQECLHSSCCFQALRSMTNGCISRLIKGDQGVRKSYEAPRRGFPNESAHNLHER